MVAFTPARTPSAQHAFTTFDRAAALPAGFVQHEGQDTSARPLHRMPLVPADVLQHHACFVSTDTRFRAGARLLQSLWREDKGLPVGLHHTPGDKPVAIRLGSRIDPVAARAGRNFVSPEVASFVRHQLVLREEGACIDEDRLYGNALSSMPLAFNLLGPLALDLDLASQVFRSLLPSFVHSVRAIGFEHSPSRGDPKFLHDGTAFDAVIDAVTPDGEPLTLFVEIKYSEGMSGPAATPRPRYDEASRQVRLYRHPDSPELRSVALEQLWREHMLSQLSVDYGVVNKAVFVAIAPKLNRRAAAAFKTYEVQLADVEPEDELRVPFVPLTLEAIVEALATAGAVELAQQLYGRYLDFRRVLAVALEPLPPAKPSKLRARRCPSSSAGRSDPKPIAVPSVRPRTAPSAVPTPKLRAGLRPRQTAKPTTAGAASTAATTPAPAAVGEAG